MHIKQTRLYGSIKKYRLKQKAVIFISAATAMASAYAATAQSPSKAEAAVESFAFSKAGVRLVSKQLYVADPKGGVPTPQREPNIIQDELLANKYSLGHVLEAGQNQFNNPFLPENGHGEGENGPRSLQREVWNNRGGTTRDPEAWPFLRVNGIDSQSCFECHNTIGEYTPADAKTVAKVRKPSAQGGSAPAASSAFINDQFPEHLSQLLDPNPDTKAVMTKFVRNPPHVFGAGYTQRLATEMTTDLLAQAFAAKTAARAALNSTQTIALLSKGSDFGSYSVVCQSKDNCTADTSLVTGVQGDLIVRPFQWGGIASSVRHFAKDALDFHFSVQAVEKVGHKDCDLDGLTDEITIGNVSALTAYVTMFRPPQQVIDNNQSALQTGEQLFNKVGCVNCHSSSLTIDEATLTIMTPAIPDEDCPQEVANLSNSTTSNDSATEAGLAINHAFTASAMTNKLAAEPTMTPEKIYQAMQPWLNKGAVALLAKDNYQIDLNLSDETKSTVPAYVWPRLESSNRSVKVPLYSDLKLHFMGDALADNYPQPTDAPGYAAQPGVYVTRALWGVSNTAPYMHDGRARTIKEAVLLHGADGSEAAPAANEFEKLTPTEQQQILQFLHSQKLPIADGVTAPEYAAN
ncbi:hypothetical protein L2755_03255 [Shewanella abyssi]|uniref:di-heme oxidoredictase family protein n=1 Tax=Shewanella abyssi TaxID=311789 RepID=UPI0020109F51|nr:di-heme oxidoredictase family protein [Shewanella abyssi]MCL1048653.1 hypothetical protein [Shewanella abyssi]